MKHRNSFLYFLGVFLVVLFVVANNSNFWRILTDKNIFDEIPTSNELLFSRISPNNEYRFDFYVVKSNAINSDVYMGELVCENKARTIFRATKVYELDKLNIEWKNEKTIIIGGGFQLDISQKKHNFNGCDISFINGDTVVVNSIELDIHRDIFNYLNYENDIIIVRRIMSISVIAIMFILIQSTIRLHNNTLSQAFTKNEQAKYLYNLHWLKRYLLIGRDRVHNNRISIVCLRIVSIITHLTVVLESLSLLCSCINIKYILLFEKITCICFVTLFNSFIISFVILKKTERQNLRIEQTNN